MIEELPAELLRLSQERDGAARLLEDLPNRIGGLLRRWSPVRTGLCEMGRSGDTFVGAYICER
jgi:hypothetical protein